MTRKAYQELCVCRIISVARGVTHLAVMPDYNCALRVIHLACVARHRFVSESNAIKTVQWIAIYTDQ